jgi:conjugative transfer signal peptidase TraF
MEKRLISSKAAPMKKQSFRKLSAREKGVVIVMLAALLVGLWLPERIIVSTSPSLNHRVFFLVPVNRGKITGGDYLVFREKEGERSFIRQGLNGKNDVLIKRVGCAPGELLTRNKNRAWLCERKNLGVPLETDSQGRQLPQFQFAGIVPQDSYFMVGDDPRSFDSRYFGFIHGDDVLYQALPLW